MVGEVIADRYELEELVDHGGMSTVYRGYDRMLERNVALKVLHPHFGDDPEYVERFRREARAVARLSHPHIVTVIDRGASEGNQFIVFEYVEGENLKQLLERSGPLPVARAVDLGIQIADALAFAHQHGLVHRDVKPQNVLIDLAGDAKVTDFGIVRSLDVERGVTQTGTVLGTSNYLSPEQANGEPVTPATDIYSLGVVLYELLAGDVPFRGDNLVVVAMKHVTEHPPNLLQVRADVPPRLAQAVDRALEKDPTRRFPSMDAFATELRRVQDELGSFDADRTMVRGTPVVAPPAPPVHPARRRGGHMPVLLGLAGLILLGVVLAVVELGGSPGGGKKAAGGRGGAAASLRAVGNYDPSGPKDSHSDTAGAATDGNPGTDWYTQIYATPEFGNLKSGIGLVLDAGSSMKLGSVTVSTPTPGFTAQIKAGPSPSGPFAADSSTQTVSSSTTFHLNGANARYYVVWISRLPSGGKAEISDVRSR
ncbi:MAG: serine/threonine protein kinase [Actinobacteria bacterium]|nr:serine/threonine protein kinase [Actinomycetota bacterium]